MQVKAIRALRTLGGYRTSHHLGKRLGATPSATAWSVSEVASRPRPSRPP